MALEKQLNSTITVNERQCNALEEKVNSFQTQLNNRAMELEGRVERVETNLKDDSKKVDSMEKNLRRLQVPFNHMQNVLPGIVNRDVSSGSNLLPTEEICLQLTPGVWVKDWKIDGLSRCFKESKGGTTYIKESDPFYLGRHGYKCKLQLTGRGTAEESLHVRLVIMRGSNDGTLSWPILKKVKSIIMDSLSTDREYKMHEISTSNLPLWEVSRPKSEENDPIFIFYFDRSMLINRNLASKDCLIIRVVFSSVETI